MSPSARRLAFYLGKSRVAADLGPLLRLGATETEWLETFVKGILAGVAEALAAGAEPRTAYEILQAAADAAANATHAAEGGGYLES